MFKVVITNLGRKIFLLKMTENNSMEYVSITRDDIVNMLNNTNRELVVVSTGLEHIIMKGLTFHKESTNLYVARTSYGFKKLHFKIEDGEVKDFMELDIIERDSDFLYVKGLYNAQYLCIDSIIFMKCRQESHIMDNQIKHDIECRANPNSFFYNSFNIPFSGSHCYDEKMNMVVIDECIQQFNIERSTDDRLDSHYGDNIVTYADIVRASNMASDYMDRHNSSFMEEYLSVDFESNYPNEIRGVNSTSNSNTFTYTKKDKEVREFIDGPGMFQIGVKKFNVLPIEEQESRINGLDYVTSEFDKDMFLGLDLGDYGIYHIYVNSSPIAKRQDTKRILDNPFIEFYTGKICLGNMKSTYDNCYNSGNYLECVKIIKEVLTCDDDSDGYRTWSECK